MNEHYVLRKKKWDEISSSFSSCPALPVLSVLQAKNDTCHKGMKS